ncbi:Flp pilus assembly protein CpaB [Thermotalea metallivorans]|uniref:SAF domain-containing protein n=1 Tax=Thermotalea metallivorans TaxID=520762 RepID=A0A140L9Y8_9FIRM|nr:Flp pilus assembly protein CpaB [Thermotalea metallivorans]KXG77363.1 hypothetical protein AN619_04890 [Thermotalea metallivorans]
MKGKNSGSIFFMLSIIAAVGAAFLFTKAAITYNQLVPVVVANPSKGDIPAFHVIQAEDVTVAMAPRSEIKKGTYKNINGVIGKATRTLIPAGEKISTKHLVVEGAKSILSAKVSEKKDGSLRGFPIPVDMVSGLGGALEIGDKVDVIGALNLPAGPMKSNKEPVSKILAAGVEIIGKIGSKEQPAGYIVNLTPKQAQDVQFALLNGKISFAVYPFEYDLKASDTKPTTTESFIFQYLANPSLIQGGNSNENANSNQ